MVPTMTRRGICLNNKLIVFLRNVTKVTVNLNIQRDLCSDKKFTWKSLLIYVRLSSVYHWA